MIVRGMRAGVRSCENTARTKGGAGDVAGTQIAVGPSNVFAHPRTRGVKSPPAPRTDVCQRPCQTGLGHGVQRVADVLAELLVHLKHVDPVDLEYRAELVVADDLLLVLGILHVVRLDVIPELLDDLRARQLLDTKERSQRFTNSGGGDEYMLAQVSVLGGAVSGRSLPGGHGRIAHQHTRGKGRT